VTNTVPVKEKVATEFLYGTTNNVLKSHLVQIIFSRKLIK